MHRVQRLLKSIFQLRPFSRRRSWAYLGLVLLALCATLGWRFFQTPVANSMSPVASPIAAQRRSSPRPIQAFKVPPFPESSLPETPALNQTFAKPQSAPQPSPVLATKPQSRPPQTTKATTSIPLPSAAPTVYFEAEQPESFVDQITQEFTDSPAQPAVTQPKLQQSTTSLPLDISNHATLLPNPDSSSGRMEDAVAVSAPGQPSPQSTTKAPLVSFTAPGLYFGKVVHKVAVDPKEKVIALTFDDGPWQGYTPKVLDILKKNQVKATFFWIGLHLELNPKIGKRVVAEGHAIGNHTWHHRYHQMSPDEASAEIEHTAKLMQSLAGVKSTLFRPPGGRLSNGLADYAEMKHQTVLLWSVMPADTDLSQTPEKIVERVLKDAHPGGIVLLHDGGGNREHTVKALPQIIAGLKKLGYHFVTIPELLKYPTVTPKIAGRPPEPNAQSLL